MTSEDNNQLKNREYYNKAYSNYSVKGILWKLNNLEEYLQGAIDTDTSWHAIYYGDFQHKLKGARVLEIGCGDCTNAAIMAAVGAEVYANDIAETSGLIIDEVNKNCSFQFPIKFIEGDFLNNDLVENQFDFIIGKAFLHHLTVPVEKRFLRESARLLKKNGEARFFEPAVNNRFIDFLRWYIPVPGRPSRFSKKAFKQWKKNDPHPDRSFSSAHWKQVGGEMFDHVQIIPMGSIERFGRLIKKKKNKWKFRKWAFHVETKLPAGINSSFARSQLIIYKKY